LYLSVLIPVKALRLVNLRPVAGGGRGEDRVSRGTVWRLPYNARKKAITAIVHGRVLDIIQPEDD